MKDANPEMSISCAIGRVLNTIRAVVPQVPGLRREIRVCSSTNADTYVDVEAKKTNGVGLCFVVVVTPSEHTVVDDKFAQECMEALHDDALNAVVIPNVCSAKEELLAEKGWYKQGNDMIWPASPWSGMLSGRDFAARCFTQLGCMCLTANDIAAFASDAAPENYVPSWTAPEFQDQMTRRSLAVAQVPDTDAFYWVRTDV